RAVAVEVAGRQELLVDRRGVAEEVVPRAEQLVVAGDRLFLAGNALAVPLGLDGGGIRPRLGQRREAGALRRDTAVDDADDDALTRVRHVAELALPRTARTVQPKELRGGDGVDGDVLVLPD